MTRIDIQLPDEVYERAKRFAANRELSLAEIIRRGLELFLDAYPEYGASTEKDWTLPKIMGLGTKVRLEELHDISSEEETTHAISSNPPNIE